MGIDSCVEMMMKGWMRLVCIRFKKVYIQTAKRLRLIKSGLKSITQTQGRGGGGSGGGPMCRSGSRYTHFAHTHGTKLEE
jgi:hypothetical protein